MKRVIIIGHNYTTRLSLVRAAYKARFEVFVIDTYSSKKKPRCIPVDCRSKYVSNFYFSKHDDSKSLCKLLLDNCILSNEKTLLIPTSDYSVLALDENKRVLAPYFYIPGVSSSNSLQYYLDKFIQKNIADELSILNTKCIKISINDKSSLNDIKYPCFPKSSSSNYGGKAGMKKCDNEIDLKLSLKQLKRWNCNEVLIEDYINIEKEYALIGVSDGKDVYIPGVLYLTKVATGAHIGVAMSGYILPCTGFESILDLYKKFVLKTGFIGLFDIDFFYSDGSYYFGEMNFRVGASVGAYEKLGINFVELLYSCFDHTIKVDKTKVITSKRKFINERICLHSWLSGEINFSEMKSFLLSGDGMLVDEHDKIPMIAFNNEIRKGIFRLPYYRLKRIIKNILKV